MPSQGFWQGAERATGRALETTINVGMGLKRLDEMQQRTGIMQNQEKRQSIAFMNAQEDRAKKKIYNERIVPVSSRIPGIGDMKELGERAAIIARGQGYEVKVMDGEIYTTNEAIDFVMGQMNTNRDFAQGALSDTMVGLQRKNAKFSAELATLIEKNAKPELITAKKKEIAANKAHIANVLSATEKMMTQKPPAPPKITQVNRGNEIDIYTDGVFTKTVTKGAVPTSPSYSKIEGAAFAQWMEGATLTAQQKQIVNKRLAETGATPEKAAALVKARMNAKIESYTEQLGRPPTKQELRALYINDPWGFLEDGGGDKLDGMDPGIYRVDGVEVKWDGTKRIN